MTSRTDTFGTEALLERQAVAAALRQDLSSFIEKCFYTLCPGHPFLPNWHVDAMAWHLQRCARGEIKRLLITVPPRSLKSVSASVAFPAWLLGHDPTLRILCASYANELAAKHARDFRAIVNADWYRTYFPRTRPLRDTELEFLTTQLGYRYATSVGGTLTGRGGGLIIIDDPMKPGEAMSKVSREGTKQWYDATLFSRLDNKAEDVIVLIMQRLHMDDLAGYVLEKEDWAHLNLPAIAHCDEFIPIGAGQAHFRKIGDLLHSAREPLSVLQEAKVNLGSMHFEAQYQQSPVPETGNLIKLDWFQLYGQRPEPTPHAQIVQSWDTASKADQLNDFSVCTTWLVTPEAFYLLEVTRERLDFPALRHRVVEMQQRHDADVVLIEDKGSGTSLIQDLRRSGQVHPIACMPETDKVTRMSAQSAKIEAGLVHLPERAPWLADFLSELMAFPASRHDDQVDSVSQFLSWTDQRRQNRLQIVKLGGL
jgi:predicted phage terminase large subunit-like protein